MKLRAILLFSLLIISSLSFAQTPVYELLIQNHKFIPSSLEVPAGQKIKLLVKNLDSTPEEFESHDFNREKIIAGHSQAYIFVGPLQPGQYKFFGEFNEATAQGALIAK